ncbi:MAG: enoyl-CoA hydratase, partial [Thermodesulfobacteriota bacterium]
MPVRSEKDGHVTTVILNRPEVRNAVDHATAQELKAAFLAFEADPEAYVGVLCG